jgi:hypothetical protein
MRPPWPVYAASHGVQSSLTIERLCRRGAGYCDIVYAHAPNHTVIARFRRRHIDSPQTVLGTLSRSG